MNKGFRVALAVALIVMGGLVVARIFFPMRLYEATKHFDLWRHGVREFHAQTPEGQMTGELRDLCEASDPEARGCTCIALIHGLGDEPETWGKLLEAPKNAWVKPVKLYAIGVQENQRYVTDEPSAQYRVRNIAKKIGEALEPLCPSWVVVGNSLGGWEAAWIALDRDLKVEKLILVDAAGLRSADRPEVVKLFAARSVAEMKELLSRIFYKRPHLPTMAWERAAEMTAHARLDDILRAQTPGDFLDGKLQTLRLPTMVIWGAADGIISDSVGKELHADIPGSIWREIPQCGHVPQKECPLPVIQGIDQMLRVGSM